MKPSIFAASKRTDCIYCSGPLVKIGKGEHMIQESIGGTLTLRTVCSECNGKFSELDKELCSRSYLAAVSSQERDSRIWQVWDVDHDADNVLIEAKPDWSRLGLRTFPQIIFELGAHYLRGDVEDFRLFGAQDLPRIIAAAAIRAFRKCCSGEKGWVHLERIEFDARNQFDRQYRFPPRVYFPHSVAELARRLARGKSASLTLRYSNSRDARFALAALQNWSGSTTWGDFQATRNSASPTFRFFFDTGKVLRALQKNAVNMLAHCCRKTIVDRQHFGSIMDQILGRVPVTANDLQNHGFVRAANVRSISVSGTHSFRLCHARGEWLIIASYFGGKIGAAIRFPGPNEEEWSVLDVTAPIDSREWVYASGRFAVPGRLKIEWKDGESIMPSVRLTNGTCLTRAITGR